MNKDSKIYVSGHTGLIGSALVRKLRQDGYVNLLLRTRTELELTDQEAVRDFFERERPEFVFVASGKVGSILVNRMYPADFLYENLAIQDNVLMSAARTGTKKLIFFGSSCAYPKNAAQPMKEEYLWTGRPEETSLAYATAKIAGIELCEYLSAQYGVDFLSVIPNTVYGPGDEFDPDKGHVLSALIRRFEEAQKQRLGEVVLWGTGKPLREFVYADDVADACLFLMQNPSPWRMLNIASGAEISIRELAELVAGKVGFKGRISWDESKPDGAPRKLLAGERLQSLGWTAKIGLDEGIKTTYDWYRTSYAQESK